MSNSALKSYINNPKIDEIRLHIERICGRELTMVEWRNLASQLEDYTNQLDESSLLFDKKIVLEIVLNHNVFNEIEAAFYCRCNVESIRYHALRSRKLTFCDFSKEGLVFLKQDLDKFLASERRTSYRG